MKSEIQRISDYVTATIANGAALSGEIDLRGYAGGIVSMPSGWTAAKLAIKHSAYSGGTFQPLYDDTGTLIEMTVSASGEYVMPDKVFACRFIKLWSESGGADANQGADRTLQANLKG